MNKGLLMLIVLCMSMTLHAQKKVYISPSGNDLWSGDQNKPFRSLDRALLEAQSVSDTLLIQVESGDYWLDRPLQITEPLKSPVIIQGKADDKPRFLGGIPIKGWERYQGNIYRAYVPEVKLYDFAFEQF